MKLLPFILLSGLGLFSLSCTTQATTKVLFHSTQCSYQNKTIKEINSAELATIYQYANRFIFPATYAPEVDRDNTMLILVARGQKNTLGYGIEITHPIEISLVAGQLQLPITFKNPKQGQLLAQITNSPCLILTTDRIQYQGIKDIP